MTKPRSVARFVVLSFFLCIAFPLMAQTQWYENGSQHFRIVYRVGHIHLVPHILNCAEASLEQLRSVFHYEPSEKITINTFDVNDYGGAAASSVPANYIWLDLSPLEPGYENIPYNERFQWLLNHELVHVIVNDLATNIEKFNRSILSKVPPEQVQPLTILYSLLTNYGRYTPRWHQEGIAVFLETWLSGGFGRGMGSFDEMYIRSWVAEGKEMPSDIHLDSMIPHRSFLTETNHYVFGGRFASYLVLKYGMPKLIEWYTPKPKDVYKGIENRFERSFGVDFRTAWSDFSEAEREFQLSNLARLDASPTTQLRRLSETPIGAVSHPHIDESGKYLYWGEHRPHSLARIQRFCLDSGASSELATLPTPSAHQVASTAFDFATNSLFFTTNNNQLFRDLWVVNVKTGDRGMLFEDCRVGHLSVSPVTHELWGIRHSNGIATLVSSAFPYDSLRELLHFDIGDEVHGIAVSRDGSRLAAVLHQADGNQSIVIADCEKIRQGEPATYIVLTDKGSPENPSWSPDGKWVFWNAYTNGVSNIYRQDVDTGATEAISHTRIGLFKPLYVNSDSLFAFEFSTDGFIPVLLANRPAQRLPAIRYLGQEIQDRHPQVKDLLVRPRSHPTADQLVTPGNEYNGFNHLKIVSFIPVLTGFQSKKVVGLFARMSDPILNHDLFAEVGLSPFHEMHQPMQFHFRMKYEYQKSFEIGWEHNSPDFYDLFNRRKRGLLGNRIQLGNTHYWIYDNPRKLKQRTEIMLYNDVRFINDNLVPVSQPDFLVGHTTLTSQYLRRSIGSSDFENGNELAASVMVFAANPANPQFGYQVYGEWDTFNTYIVPHNVFHLKLAAGYHKENRRFIQSRFYFGGFGNRELENVDVKQFRKVFRFPGAPIYSIGVDRFAKLMFENNFPPIRFGNVSIGDHFMSHVDASFFCQSFIANGRHWYGVDVGVQANIVFMHWFNLESTLSFGAARAWINERRSNEWFISFKLLKN